MDYATFTRTGAPTWETAAALMARARGRGLRRLDHDELERLASHHRRLVSDYAYARSHFPGSDNERRLRQLAFEGHRLLSTRHEPFLRRVAHFFWSGFPRTFRAMAPTLAVAVAIFLGSALLGFVLTAVQESFSSLFLPPDVISELRDGEIWTDRVSALLPPAVLSSAIMTNNMSVALVAWAGGALAGLLTLYVLVFNGLMLGSVLALTLRYGLIDRLFEFIAAHGPLELLLITVAAAGGLELARGQLSPGLRGRAASFQERGRRSVRLVVGALPWLVLLGLVEGYVSPVMTLPLALKATLGIGLFCAFLLYAAGALSRPSRSARPAEPRP
jgi:uncharacterized membrane protein SpoIIM required for sporulation